MCVCVETSANESLLVLTSINGTYMPFCRTLIKKFTVFYQGPKFYNSLNEGIVNSTSPASFKKTFKAFICNNY